MTDTDSIVAPARHLSLEPPLPAFNAKRTARQSTLESADQAAGIFSLYGGGRESLYSDPDDHIAQGSNGDDVGRGHEDVTVQPRPYRNPTLGGSSIASPGSSRGPTGSGQVEELLVDQTSPQSWDGPMSELNGGIPASTASLYSNRDSQVQPSPTPDIRITPDKEGANHRNRHSMIDSASSSVATTPTHRSVQRLSAAHPLGSRVSSNTSASGSIGPNGSQVSVAGSVQYPGEEADAFHVRSTYARLESEGVHGDGWDPGVERTRGGPSTSKRATLFNASQDRDVGEKEREYLASLDRYGFVNEPLRNRSETRLALIPTAPLLKIPDLPAVSPLKGVPAEKPASANAGQYEEGPSAKVPSSPKLGGDDQRHRAKETERVDKWMKMMSVKKRDQGGNIAEWAWRSDGQGSKLPKRVYKGIPDRWRMAAWWTMAEELSSQSAKGKGKAKSQAVDLANDYRHSIDLPSTFDVQIDLDVPRTISGQTLFVTRYGAGQRSLFHVLHCFSMRCKTCEYVQGMGPIAATLLCYYDPERAYSLLVRLHDDYGMHSIFAPGFPGLLEAFYVQERLMEHLMPDVYQSFQRNMISSTSWGTKWYITLFVNTLPFSQQLRLWDALWLDGRDVMVMVTVAILWAFRDLLAAKTATFESILSLLSSYFVAEDENALLRWVRKMLSRPGVRTRMDGWRKEWEGLVRDGKSGDALL